MGPHSERTWEQLPGLFRVSEIGEFIDGGADTEIRACRAHAYGSGLELYRVYVRLESTTMQLNANGPPNRGSN